MVENHWPMVRRLLRFHCSPNDQDSNGNTPCHMAFDARSPGAHHCFRALHDMILGADCDVNIPNDDGLTVAELLQRTPDPIGHNNILLTILPSPHGFPG